MTRAGGWLLAGLAVIALLASSAPAADLHLQLDLHVIGAPSVTPWRSDPLCSTLPTNCAELMEHQADPFESRVRPDGASTAMDVGPPGFEDRGPPGEDVGLGTKLHDAGHAGNLSKGRAPIFHEITVFS